MKKSNNFILILFLAIIPYKLILSMEIDENKLDTYLQSEYKKKLKNLAKNAQTKDEFCVSLWQANFITSSSRMKNPVTISAYGLNGSIATGILVSYSNNDQYAGITHYPRASLKEQIAAIKKQCSQASNAQYQDKVISYIHFYITWPDAVQTTSLLHRNINWDNDIRTLKHIAYQELSEENIAITMNLMPYNLTRSLSQKPKPFKIILHQEKARIISLNSNSITTLTGTHS